MYYDPVQVFPLDIGNDTVVIFDPLISEYDPDVIKLVSCSTQLSMEFKLLFTTEIAKINGNFQV